MNHQNKLTKASLGFILEDYEIKDPILQLIAFESNDIEGSKRYRVVLSDSIYSWPICCLIGDQANRIDNLELDLFCLIKLKKYNLIKIEDKKVIVLLDSQVLVKGSEINLKLGDPIQYGKSNAPPLSNFKKNYHLQPIKTEEDEFYDHLINSINDSDLNNNTSVNNNTTNNTSIKNSSINNSSINTTNNNQIISCSSSNSDIGLNGQTGDLTCNMINQLLIQSPKKLKDNSGQAVSKFMNNNDDQSDVLLLNTDLICDLSTLNQYTFRWIVRGRVTSKTAIKHYTNKKGSGSFFSFKFKDQSSEIKVTVFGQQAIDRFYKLIEINKCYLISRGNVKLANQEFNKTEHPFEIALDCGSIVQLYEEEINCAPIVYNFVNFEQIKHLSVGTVVDTIGIIKEIEDIATYIKKKDNSEGLKRNLFLIDQTRNEMLVTLWDEIALSFNGQLNDVCILRDVTISDYKNLSLSTSPFTVIEVNKEMSEKNDLKEWWTSVENDDSFQINKLVKRPFTIAGYSKLALINLDNIKKYDGLSIQTVSMITRIGKINLYKGCPNCFKKLVELSANLYRCEKCSQTDHFEWQFIVKICIADYSNDQYVQLFNNGLKKLLNLRYLNQLAYFYNENRTIFDNMLEVILFKRYKFKLKSKIDNYNNQERIETIVDDVNQIDYFEYAKSLIDQISN